MTNSGLTSARTASRPMCGALAAVLLGALAAGWCVGAHRRRCAGGSSGSAGGSNTHPVTGRAAGTAAAATRPRVR